MVKELEVPIGSVKLATGLVIEDDWFAVQAMDEGTLAIGEPAYHQENWSYLICDKHESLLFDTGAGRRPIAPLVSRHAKENVQAFPSHMHYDHLGGIGEFNSIIVADLEILRDCEQDGVLTPTADLHLGHHENVETPSFKVSRWLAPGEVVSIGTRRLEIVHTPGHSPDSISLWEPEKNRLYAADFVYPGPLYAQTPGASLPDYLKTCTMLINLLPKDVEIVCAHGGTDVEGAHEMPMLEYADLESLADALNRLLAQDDPCEGETQVNERMTLMHSVQSFEE